MKFEDIEKAFKEISIYTIVSCCGRHIDAYAYLWRPGTEIKIHLRSVKDGDDTSSLSNKDKDIIVKRFNKIYSDIHTPKLS